MVAGFLNEQVAVVGGAEVKEEVDGGGREVGTKEFERTVGVGKIERGAGAGVGETGAKQG
jgi:hypothetical protein